MSLPLHGRVLEEDRMTSWEDVDVRECRVVPASPLVSSVRKK